MRRSPKELFRARNGLILAALVLFGLHAAFATTLLRIDSLPELVGESTRAMLATVTSVHFDYDEHQLPATFVELRVEDALYGDSLPPAGQTLQLKLYGAAAPMADGLQVRLDGTPRYRVGERYLLLLIDDSPWGFTNTVGLLLGAFRVQEGADGVPMAESLGGNRLVLGREGPVPYAELRALLVSLKRGEVAP